MSDAHCIKLGKFELDDGLSRCSVRLSFRTVSDEILFKISNRGMYMFDTSERISAKVVGCDICDGAEV